MAPLFLMKMAQKFASLFFSKLLLGWFFPPKESSALAILKHPLASGQIKSKTT